MIDHYKRIWAEIDLDAIHENMENMHRNLRPGTMMAGVIKKDGYGHGAVPIAREIEPLPYVWGYCTATFEEADELRQGGLKKPILLLGYVFPYCYERLADENIRPSVFREDMLDELSKTAVQTGKIIKIFLAVDTGMSRIGIRPDGTGLSFVKKAMDTEGIEVEGIFTHFAKADETDKSAAMEQLRRFSDFTDAIEKKLGKKIPIVTCSNSAGIVEIPEANKDMVRAGITLYGLWPSNEVSRKIVSLKPALSLYSSVVYLKTVPAGTAVSYGGTFVTSKETRIATISAGYGDGYPRALSNKGTTVLIRGKRCPILGRICMDQFMADVTDVPEAALGDKVTLIGTDGEETITAEELGDISGKFNYELVCGLDKRIPRVYKKGGKEVFARDYFLEEKDLFEKQDD